MAINPETAFVGKIAPSSAKYPFGEARDITAPGDGTGTPWKALLVNDIFGFQQSLLDRASITPSGSPDEVGTSQYMQSLGVISGILHNTVADMVADAELIVGMRVIVLGRSTIGDGGDNIYDIVAAATGTDDGGLFIDLATHQAKGLFPGGIANIKQWGAVGDGSADDTTKVQAALDSGFKEIFAPEGTYKTTATLVKPVRVKFHGDGSFHSIITAAHNLTIIKTTPVALDGDTYNTIEDMGFTNAATFNSVIGIELANLNQVTIKRVRVTGGPAIGVQCVFVLNSLFEQMSITDCTSFGMIISSVSMAVGNNRNVYRDLNFNTNNIGIRLDGTGTLLSVFEDVGIETSTTFPVEILNGEQVIFNRLYLEGNTNSVSLVGGNQIVFRDCHNVSAVQFIENTPGATNILVDRLDDPTGAGVAVSANIMQYRQGQFEFPSTQIPSTDVNTLDDYEEGTWTPGDSSGAGLSLTSGDNRYTKVGRVVTMNFDITFPVTADTTAVNIGGFPFISEVLNAVNISFSTVPALLRGSTLASSNLFILFDSSGVQITNNQLSNTTFRGTITYVTTT